MYYNKKMNTYVQIRTEEMIAAMILEVTEREIANSEGRAEGALTDEDCADLGQSILLAVLAKFRPELVED